MDDGNLKIEHFRQNPLGYIASGNSHGRRVKLWQGKMKCWIKL